MSKASREWKASCKNDCREGFFWRRKDMTLSSYKAMKRRDQQWMKAESAHLKKAISELDAGNGVKTVWVEHDGIGHFVAVPANEGSEYEEATEYI